MSSSPRSPFLVCEERSDLQKSQLPWYFAFFVISGFCGLVYEVVWVRLAMASFGVTTALVSIVLSIFMAGLGLGSWGTGVLTRRLAGLRGPNALRAYAMVELLIGASAILVPIELKLSRGVLLHLGNLVAWQTVQYYLVSGLLLVIALLPWCTLLGSTFPLLMSVIRRSDPSASERSFSYLYLANVIGALLGTVVSAFVLIELFGFQGTLWISAGMNGVLALLALWSSSQLKVVSRQEDHVNYRRGLSALYGFPRKAMLLMLFTTGLVSMGSEVVWMRQFTPYLGNFVYAFALILGVYLAATVLGARDYRRWISSHHPNATSITWSLVAVSALIPAAGANPVLHFTGAGFNGIRILSIVLFCALAGFLTPLLVDAWSGGEPDGAGVAYAFNILGCIVGPLIASFWLEPWLGERWSLFALSLPLFAIAGAVAFRNSAESDGAPIANTNLKTSFAIAIGTGLLLIKFSGDFAEQKIFSEVRRDYAATVIASGSGFDRALLVNGTGMTTLNPITKYIAHLPLAYMDRPPRNGLVICFGMGTSFRSMLSWGISTTAVDLIPSVPKLFPYFHSDAEQVMRSPNARVVIDDGRRFLDGSNQIFDVIVVDPPPPVPAPGSSLLYSREFYEVVKRHLASDGVFQNWFPAVDGDDATAASIAKTLKEAFPYVRAFRSFDRRFGIHFIASMRPLPNLTGTDLAARMPVAARADLVEWGPVAAPAGQLDIVLTQEVSLKELIDRAPGIPSLRDDRPINEYFLLRRWFGASR